MADPTWNRRGPWFAAFVVAIAACVGSVFALVVVVANGGDAGGLGPLDVPFTGDSGPPTYEGTIAPDLLAKAQGALPGLTAVEPGKQADITFAPGKGEGSVVARYYVPVAPIWAGVDALTSDQLKRVTVGNNAATWSSIGGTQDRGPLYVAAARDIQAISKFAAPPAELVEPSETIPVLLASFEDNIFSWLPVEEIGPNMSALAVDGIDIVRGKGDPADWPYVERMTVRGNTGRGRDAAPAVTAALTAKLPTVTTVVATGDILQSRCTLTAIQATGDWGAALRGPVGEYLATADLALGSLDGSIQDIGTPWGCVSTTNLTSPPQVMEALTLAGLDGVTVATNHVFDCGQAFCDDRAFLRTLELLDQAGIRHVGGGKNLEEALAPAIFEVNGVRFGVLGFDDVAAYELEATATAPGTAPLDDSYAEENAAGEPAFFRSAEELSLERFTERIRALKQQVDVVIVQVQSGTEDTHDPSVRSIKALRAAADAGADLAVGNQAHHVQAIEPRENAFIAYALGNFVFDQVHTPEHTQGYLLEATFHGKRLVNVRFEPYQIEGKYKPTFVGAQLRAKILRDVFDASKRLLEP